MKRSDVYLFNNGSGRGGLFEEFLAQQGLQSADVIIGPLGDSLTSGLVAIPGKVTNQVVLRSELAIRAVSRALE